MKASRRAFLRALGATAALPWAASREIGAAPAASPSVAATGTARLDPVRFAMESGFPVPALEWRGDTSVGMARRAGTSVSAPMPVREGWPQDPGGPGDPRVPLRPDVPAIDPVWQLRARFHDLRRHFVFEYYPWYGTSPWYHWDEAGRVPPLDLASNYMPRLGAYDSASRSVLEQHARWIADAGVGAIAVSWWGPGSFTDARVPLLMDVMRDHDIHVTFHIEPYRNDRADVLLDDVAYLVREYGDRRRWDAFLLVSDADGRTGPVLKLFRTILPKQSTDCHGRTTPVPDYIEDAQWRRATSGVRTAFRQAFDRIVLLADSLDVSRTQASGFDGMAIYDPFVKPDSWPAWSSAFSRAGLVFSFNVNCGFDGIGLREVAPDSCYSPPSFEPGGGDFAWSQAAERERAMQRSAQRIADSFDATLRLQADPAASNAQRGFLLVYVNSFNEWHEGTAFEPMKADTELTPAEARFGYHNPSSGEYRLRTLTRLMAPVVRR